MKLIETPSMSTASGEIAREMTQLEKLIAGIKYRLMRLRRKLPYLVWYGDELDVGVTLSQDKLTADSLDGAFRQFNSCAFVEIEKIFSEMGIGFDKGLGCDGRDWEWDWSLKGPISVRFRSRATKPHLRIGRPKPRLVASALSSPDGGKTP
jgi:hypothetical protein